MTCSLISLLAELDARDAGIESVSGIHNLTSLRYLAVGSNSLTDITALVALKNIDYLDLKDNPSLTDIQPLLDNAGLGTGDDVDLRSTNVSCADVALLEAKGVRVTWDWWLCT